MSFRPLLVAALAAGTLALAPAWAPPNTTRYRIDYKANQVVDLTPLGQTEQKQSFGWSSFLNVTLNDSAGGRALTAVLDSVTIEPGSPMPAAAFDSVKGARWTGWISPQGKVSGLTAVVERPGVRQAEGLLAGFYPLVGGFYPRVKRGAKVGDTWTDTLDLPRNDEAVAMTTRTVTNYSVTGTESRNGVKALKIEAAFSVAHAGAIASPQGEVKVDGTGTGSGTYYVAPDGRFLGGSQTTNSDISAAMANLPTPLTIKDTSTLTVSILP
ncbi:MAG TPA: hypothetical protein VNK43_10370 [Gemmatimonadales bacterium]|nr:hypothetical protein [Gemmatimonadales bacterium]